MNFIKAKDTYRKHAIVQRKMAKKLILELKTRCGTDFQDIFEIGAGTGLLSDEIVSNLNFERFILNDLTDNFTNIKPFRYYKGNVLDIDYKTLLEYGATGTIKTKGFDLIMASAVFQWIEDKELLCSKLYHLLDDSGILAFSTFGQNNFSQIKDVIGFSLDYTDMTPFLEKAGFEILYFEEELETLYFKDVRNILEHIKLTGVGNNANCIWTKSKYEEMRKTYTQRFLDNNGVELTYHPMYFICKKT